MSSEAIFILFNAVRKCLGCRMSLYYKQSHKCFLVVFTNLFRWFSRYMMQFMRKLLICTLITNRKRRLEFSYSVFSWRHLDFAFLRNPDFKTVKEARVNCPEIRSQSLLAWNLSEILPRRFLANWRIVWVNSKLSWIVLFICEMRTLSALYQGFECSLFVFSSDGVHRQLLFMLTVSCQRSKGGRTTLDK